MAVALHVRFFDKYNEKRINNVSPEYYVRAIDIMENISKCVNYFVF